MVAVSLVLAPTAHAVELKVDFGVGDVERFESVTPNEVQAGFGDFSLNANRPPPFGDIVDIAAIGFDVVSRVFEGVTVEVESLDGDDGFFDGPDEELPLGDLFEDGVYHFDGDVIVRLKDLPPGLYEMTTYHYVSELLEAVSNGSTFDILLDAGGGESAVATDISASSAGELHAIAIPFVATGDDVDLRLSGGLWINGFTLALVPEPASWLLLALGGMGLLVCVRRRNRLPAVRRLARPDLTARRSVR